MLQKNYTDLAQFLLRLSFGATMLIAHGWPKLIGFTDKAAVFPDPIGLGSQISLALAVFAEVFCSVLIIVGFKTKFFVTPLIVTMLVAIFLVHGGDPFKKYELAVMYLTGYIAIFLAGPGAYSVDRK